MLPIMNAMTHGTRAVASLQPVGEAKAKTQNVFCRLVGASTCAKIGATQCALRSMHASTQNIPAVVGHSRSA